MKVIEAKDLDSLESYREVDRDVPELTDGDVVIRMRACGVGYVDALVALGRYQVKPRLPHTPGSELAGVVEQVGLGVQHLKPGDRVLASSRSGGFAELVRAPVDDVMAIPDNMTFEQAAGFRVNYLTAIHGLSDRAALRSGETLLVFGAAGGVGSAAVQVGRALGATVVAAASSAERRRAAHDFGAHVVVDTEVEGWRDRLKSAATAGVDVVFDPVCGPLFEPAFRSLSWRGRHLIVGFVGGAFPALPANLPLMKGASLVGVDVRQYLEKQMGAARGDLSRLLAMVSDGRLKPPVGQAYKWAEARDALVFATTGKGLGKTVLLGP